MGALSRRLAALELRVPAGRCQTCRDWPTARVVHRDPFMADLTAQWAERWELASGRAVPERCPACSWSPLTIVVAYQEGWQPPTWAASDDA